MWTELTLDSVASWRDGGVVVSGDRFGCRVIVGLGPWSSLPLFLSSSSHFLHSSTTQRYEVVLLVLIRILPFDRFLASCSEFILIFDI